MKLRNRHNRGTVDAHALYCVHHAIKSCQYRTGKAHMRRGCYYARTCDGCYWYKLRNEEPCGYTGNLCGRLFNHFTFKVRPLVAKRYIELLNYFGHDMTEEQIESVQWIK